MKWNIFICPLIALVFFVTLCNATDIYTAQQFVAFIESSSSEKNISLKADLDFSTRALSVPLGVKSDGSCVPFRGTLNGNGHSIKNLVMRTQSTGTYENRGLFCDLKNATIENLVFDKSCNIQGQYAGSLSVEISGIVVLRNVTNRGFVTGGQCAGGLVGFTESESPLTLDHCINEGTINSGIDDYKYYCGGLVGYLKNSHNVTITNCKNTGNLKGGSTGGLFGFSQSFFDATIENSTNSGIVFAGSYSGGLIGYSDIASLAILHCNNTGNINSTSVSGGFIGYLAPPYQFSKKTTFIDSHNTGSVRGSYKAGGFAGQTSFCNNTNMINCSNTGNIYAWCSGGFIGFMLHNYGVFTIKNSKNTGSVLCDNYCGGIIGLRVLHKETDCINLESVANYGTVKSDNWIACGFMCQKSDLEYYHPRFTFKNCILKGKVSGVEAYGLINKVVGYGDLISISYVGVFAEINGTSKAYTFIDYNDASLSGIFALKSLCKNCVKEVQNLTKRNDGQYYLENSNTLAIGHINLAPITHEWEMVWTENLELIPMLWISFGSPLNDVIRIGPGIPLERQMSESQKEKASGYFIVKNVTNDLIQPEFDTFNESTQIILCYSMTIKSSGAKDIILYIENNNIIISNPAIMFLCIFGYPGFIDYYDPSVTYELDSIMTKDLTVLFVYKHEVKFKLPVNKTVYVYPRDKFSVAVKIAKFSLDDYVLKNKSDGQELNGDTVIESDVIVEVSCQVVVEGAYEGSWIVEAGSTLGNISQLEPYFGENYVVVDTVELLVVDQGTVVKKNMRLHVGEPQQEVSVKIGSPVDMTVNVSVGTRLGDISALKPYFVSWYFVVDGNNSSVVYSKDTFVMQDMVLSIVKKWVVVVTITPTNASLVDESEVKRMVKNLAGGAVSVKSKVVDGKVTQLEVTVDSRERADMIVSYLNDLDKGEGCQAEIFCKVVHVHVAGEGGLSKGSQHTVSVVVALVAALFVVLF